MMDRDVTGTKQGVAFGPFRLFAAQRLLEKRGVALPLSSRALDILTILVERAGEVVTKKELIARAWPNLTVDEDSLRVQVASLRKTLGDGQGGARYVTNVPGRGYCFVAPVIRPVEPKAVSSAQPANTDQAHRLPPQLVRMVGRDEAVRTLSEQLAARRFVTIHGPAGIGKTTVAVSVGHAQLGPFEGAVRFFDLGAISDPRVLPSAVASTLGLLVQSRDPTPNLLSFLRERRMLLILDSCEHVIEAAAGLAERISDLTRDARLEP
jgi:DNA-binding winged helix-turn-helix (wHTH) protein